MDLRVDLSSIRGAAVMVETLLRAFGLLVATPFQHSTLVWGVVPLYVSWLLSELTPQRRSYRTALQSGFGFLWAAAQWFAKHEGAVHRTSAANTLCALGFAAIGLLALWAGLRKRYPWRLRFLGHARFGNYLTIAVYPMTTGWLPWTVERAAAVALFAPVAWAAVHVLLMPWRK